MTLKAPFPYFGGKARVAAEVWSRFGDPANYVEPFFGSGAVLLGRPAFEGNRIETVNDMDGHLANFWRALRADPDAVAYHADWPVSELDLHARGDWLYYRPGAREWVERLRDDAEFYDAKSAGWWVWFASCWIGGLPAMSETVVDDRKLPHAGNAGRGVHRKLPHAGNAGMGVHRKLPHAGDAGMGVHRKLPHAGDAGRGVHRQLPHAGDAGRGVHRQLPHAGNAGMGVHRKLPHAGNAGTGNGVTRQMPETNYRGVAAVGGGGPRREMLIAYFRQLAARLERVRVVCGDWARVTGPSVTFKHGVTAVFLDPPYSHDERAAQIYSQESATAAAECREWAIANGDNPLLRIALCGYDTEHGAAMPDGWHAHAWKARGGYGSQGNGRGRENAGREVIWFSPACINPLESLPLFGYATR